MRTCLLPGTGASSMALSQRRPEALTKQSFGMLQEFVHFAKRRSNLGHEATQGQARIADRFSDIVLSHRAHVVGFHRFTPKNDAEPDAAPPPSGQEQKQNIPQ